MNQFTKYHDPWISIIVKVAYILVAVNIFCQAYKNKF